EISENVNLTSTPIKNDKNIKEKILDIIKSNNDPTQIIENLEKEELIWNFISGLDHGHYEKIKGKEFGAIKKVNREVNKKIKESLCQEWLGYKSLDNSLNIRLQSDNPKPIEMNKFMALEDYDNFNIYLSEGNEIALKKEDGKRYYDFSKTNSPSEMTIKWRAGEIDYTLIVEVGSNGISTIKDFKIGKDSTVDKNTILNSVKTNEEVFLNGNSLSESLENYLKNRTKVKEIYEGKSLGEDITPTSANQAAQKLRPTPRHRNQANKSHENSYNESNLS
uniref:hypothetical protein n=1 Tax=Wolbachia endosymbiont of Pentidionis agamae TaxID=3110435 RepID=UPI002FD345B9